MPDATHIATSGCLISAAFIENLREPGSRQRGVEPRSFALPWSEPPKSPAAMEDTVADALGVEGLDMLVTQTAKSRRQELVAERCSMKHQTKQQQGAETAEWLQGIDALSPGGFDSLTLTLYYPG